MELARIGDDPAPDSQVGYVALDDARGKKVQLNPGRRVARIGAPVDLHDNGHGPSGGAQLLRDLRHQAALALVAEGNADVCYELA